MLHRLHMHSLIHITEYCETVLKCKTTLLPPASVHAASNWGYGTRIIRHAAIMMTARPARVPDTATEFGGRAAQHATTTLNTACHMLDDTRCDCSGESFERALARKRFAGARATNKGCPVFARQQRACSSNQTAIATHCTNGNRRRTIYVCAG